jgi:hypothetical protein
MEVGLSLAIHSLSRVSYEKPLSSWALLLLRGGSVIHVVQSKKT